MRHAMLSRYAGELSPCPKCGGMTVVIGDAASPSVWCTECETAFMPDMGEAIREWWNMRHGEGERKGESDEQRRV